MRRATGAHQALPTVDVCTHKRLHWRPTFETVAGFDWDEVNRTKCTRHGVSIDEIESIFGGEVWVVRFVFLALTLRVRAGQQWIRPISARYMHAEEIRHYEAEIARRKN